MVCFAQYAVIETNILKLICLFIGCLAISWNLNAPFFFIAFAVQIHCFEWVLDINWSITVIGSRSNVGIHDIPLYPFIMMDFFPTKVLMPNNESNSISIRH
jgi:hypothetical protein